MDLEGWNRSRNNLVTTKSASDRARLDPEFPEDQPAESDDEPPPGNMATVGANYPSFKQESGASLNAAKFRQILGDTHRCQSPDRSSSEESMINNNENLTPPESPFHLGSSGAVATDGIGRLSLDAGPRTAALGTAGSEPRNTSDVPSSKRTASHELPRDSTKHSTAWQRSKQDQCKPQKSQGLYRSKRGRVNHSKQSALRNHAPPVPQDSGYASRQNTIQVQGFAPDTPSSKLVPNPSLATLDEVSTGPIKLKSEGARSGPPDAVRYPGLILQPESCPISKDQLAAEVKGIYAGLVMVEAKCINIDSAQAADPSSHLGPEQWQALIALHRTLLYEHHDFLMATQHPSATVALRGLANKYSMPARMWKHGIHAFLEVLRHRRPESQDYMLAFIYLAYQMMALLFETVPMFLDTWIECLGDLARYRMAIEEEREAHTTWGAVAGRWYRMAADRHPETGRLNHHLGILERPSLRKLFLYTKSLTCVIPFVNARESMATLCGPIVRDEQTLQHKNQTAEARIVTLFALFFSAHDEDTTGKIAKDTIIRLGSQSGTKIKDIGVELVVTGVGFLFELGAPSNKLWQLFSRSISKAIESSRPSTLAAAGSSNSAPLSQNQSSTTATFANSMIYDFVSNTFHLLLRHRNHRQSLRDGLPSVHVMLVFLHAIHTVHLRSSEDLTSDTFSSFLGLDVFPWGELSEYLNTLSQTTSISARTIALARQGMFMTPERPEEARPLPEDLLIRGLIWSQLFYPSDWFSAPIDDEGRAIETADMQKARVERVQWLGLYFAFHLGYMNFEPTTKSFSVPMPAKPAAAAKLINPEVILERHALRPNESTPPSQSSTNISANSDSDGYAVVSSARKKPVKSSTKSNSNPTKVEPGYSAVKVVDTDTMQWEQEC